MRLDGSNVCDWRRTGVHPRYGVRLESATLATHVYVPAHMIAATDALGRSPEAARGGGEPVDHPPVQAPAPATIQPGTHARHTDPTASSEAAARAAITATFDAWLVLAAHVAAGESGLTGDELATWTCRKYEHVGPRRPWLMEAGWVVLTDQPKRNRKGVYVATDAGRAAWSRVHPDVRTNVMVSLHGDAVKALTIAGWAAA